MAVIKPVLTAFALVAVAGEHRGAPDAFVGSLPLDTWTESSKKDNLRWSSEISKPVLTQHQRLKIRIEIGVDGSQLLKWRGQGRLFLFVQARDASGDLFQNHNSLSLDDLKPDIKKIESIYTQDAFVVPGDYQLVLGLFVPLTGDHAIVLRSLHVDEITHDPLASPWRGVPSIEFLPDISPPESWFLPTVEGRVNLSIETKRFIKVETIVNGSSTEQAPTRLWTRDGKVRAGDLLPAMKVLSQISVRKGAAELAMLDLERRQVTYSHSGDAPLDWKSLKDSLEAASSNKIGIGDLIHREQNAQFVLSEVRRRILERNEVPRVVILLSGPMVFGKADLHPIEGGQYDNLRVFYIRYHLSNGIPPPTPVTFPELVGGRRGRGGDGGPPISRQLDDQLFDLIKPLRPRLFDVATPMEFRRALAAVINETNAFAGN